MHKSPSQHIIEETEGDQIIDEGNKNYQINTFIVPHATNFSTDKESETKTAIQQTSQLKYCPYCYKPTLQSNFYFQMLHQISNSGMSQLYFKDLGPFGSGSFGSVIKVMHHIQDIDLQQYAIKRISVGASKLKPTIVSDLIGFLPFQSFFSIKSTIKRRLIIYNFQATCILQTYKQLKIKQPLQLRHSTTFDKTVLPFNICMVINRRLTIKFIIVLIVDHRIF
ncbi:Kinase [Hexamita inflata]|uniref:Kinase n=1 Tax=Hexamita inflata TaxID=28002 RepID=A0ABP1JU45_9EUKA